MTQHFVAVAALAVAALLWTPTALSARGAKNAAAREEIAAHGHEAAARANEEAARLYEEAAALHRAAAAHHRQAEHSPDKAHAVEAGKAAMRAHEMSHRAMHDGQLAK